MLTEPHPLNRLAAWLAPKTESTASANIIHCELFFPHAQDRIQSLHEPANLRGDAYGIFFHGPVWEFDNKKYSNKHYIFKNLSCTPSQVDRMKAFLKDQVGKPFNYLGYASFLSPCRVSGRIPGMTTRYYCSQLTMEALNRGGVFGKDAHGQDLHLPTNVHPAEVFYNLDPYATMTSHPMRHATLKL